MTNIAEIRDAVNVLKIEGKRADALRTAVDTVEKYIQAQPAIAQLEEKTARAQQELGRLQASVKDGTAKLAELHTGQQGVINDTKKQIKDLKQAANDEIAVANKRATDAKAQTSKILAECHAEIQAERKELEALKVEKANLAQRLTA